MSRVKLVTGFKYKFHRQASEFLFRKKEEIIKFLRFSRNFYLQDKIISLHLKIARPSYNFKKIIKKHKNFYKNSIKVKNFYLLIKICKNR